MKIWVDADACPVVIKDILYKAAKRTQITTTFVANQYQRIPASPWLKFIKVNAGFDVADNTIVEKVQNNDLVISSDIPLANDVINKGAQVLSPRGELLTTDNIAARLTMRNFMDTLRSSGVDTGGEAPMNHSDRMAFANQLDKILSKQYPRKNP